MFTSDPDATPRRSGERLGEFVQVTFEVPAGVARRHAELVAEFALWSPLAMDRSRDGSHRVTVLLARGRRWRYQFVVDDGRRINDPRAGCYEHTPSWGDVSVINV